MSMNGWINIYKPSGISSAKYIHLLKQYTKSKIGFVGTLDPLAEGVLPVAIGQANKLIQFLHLDIKEYEFVIEFGKRTSTGDKEGEIIEESNELPDFFRFSRNYFLGEQKQVPPKYSAIKIDGIRAYKLAREGKDFTIKPKKINIYDLDIIWKKSDSIRLHVKCSKGTYIRSLAEDIAQSLGTIGYVRELKRVSVGKFGINNAVQIDGNILSNIAPLENSLPHIPIVEISDDFALKIRHGKRLPIQIKDQLIQLYNGGKLFSVGHMLDGLFFSKIIIV